MSSEPSFKPHINVPSEERGRRGSWRDLRDKLRWRSKSRNPSQTPPQCEPRLSLEPFNRNLEGTVCNAHLSTVLVSAPPVSSDSTQNKDGIRVKSTVPSKDDIQVKNNIQTTEHVAIVEDEVSLTVHTDLWSAAYREAVLSFGEEVKSVLAKGEKIEKLLMSLEEMNDDIAGDSLFRRGVRRLQIPLTNFKLALDLASPLASIEPTASTAVGVVSSVTAVAIAICGAEASLNAQVVTMLEQVAIIDECDTLGQKLDTGNAIHKALVPVYKDLLKFYVAATEILTSKVFVLALVCDRFRQRLPTIVSDFLEHATLLRSRIGNATLELVTDIKKLLQENKIQKLLGVNKDKERSELHCKIRGLRASDACKWIFDEPKMHKWYNSPTSEHLVLFGDTGCGKTVLTAHVIDELIHLCKHQLPRPLICYHYCKDDATGNVVYIYSSLILQLLDQQEGLKVEFDKWYDNTRKSERVDPAQSSVDLGNFFSACIETLDRALFIVIDGLEECDSDSQSNLVTLLDSVSNRTPRLKVFFSSRPQERIENLLHQKPQIRWMPSRERDTIIVEYIVKRRLREFPLTIQFLVISRLSELAQGSAIWVKLIIDLIQKRQTKAIGPMKAFLADIPSPAALSQLYAKLFAQQTEGDAENERLATNALEILAAARRPLSIAELGWAVALSDAGTDSRTVDELEDCVDERRTLSLLQPFISQVDFQDVKKSQVRLVHHSLKELILCDVPSNWVRSQSIAGTSKPDKRRIQLRQPKLEACLLRICVKYLLFDEFDQKDLFSKEQETAQRLEELPGFGLFDDSSSDDGQQLGSSAKTGSSENNQSATAMYYDPLERGFGEFFVYASCFWVDHFRLAAPEALPETLDIIQLCRAKSKRLRNWVGQNCRPDCTITPKFIHDSDFLDPLIVTALYGPEIALKTLLQKQDISSKDYLTDSVRQAVQQIFRFGDVSRLYILFRDSHIGSKVQTWGFFHQLMEAWACSKRDLRKWKVLFDLVFDIVDELVREQWGNELLCQAASIGCLPIIERLFEEAARNPAMKTELLRDPQRDSKHPEYHQSIGEAVWHDRVDVLRYLLKQDGIEVHLRHRDSGGYNVLHKAARCCNPEVVTLLITHFKEGVNQANNVGDTPLCQVVFDAKSASGSIETAKILLTLGGADVRGGFTDELSNWHEPLRMAARYGHVAMCRVLVQVGGADPRRVLKVGEDGQPCLIDGTEYKELGSETLETLCSLAGMDL